MSIYYGGRSADEPPEDRGFDSDPGLDDALWVEVTRGIVHRGPCSPTRNAAHWSPDVAGDNDRPCPTCLPEGLP